MEAASGEPSQGRETFAGLNVSIPSRSWSISSPGNQSFSFFPPDGLLVLLAFSEINYIAFFSFSFSWHALILSLTSPLVFGELGLSAEGRTSQASIRNALLHPPLLSSLLDLVWSMEANSSLPGKLWSGHWDWIGVDWEDDAIM